MCCSGSRSILARRDANPRESNKRQNSGREAKILLSLIPLVLLVIFILRLVTLVVLFGIIKFWIRVNLRKVCDDRVAENY